jgi:hypothetical protein
MPVMMFAIVFGLSTDYQVFLLSRIQEEWHVHHDNARAVHDGMTRVSGVITGAAVIMIAVFASFVVGGQRLLRRSASGSPPPSPWTRSSSGSPSSPPSCTSWATGTGGCPPG